jgi:hypothetical protein
VGEGGFDLADSGEKNRIVEAGGRSGIANDLGIVSAATLGVALAIVAIGLKVAANFGGTGTKAKGNCQEGQ